MAEQELFDNRITGKLVAEAVLRLFEADGTVYLATGYLTWSGWLAIRDPLVEFLARSLENEAVVVVSTGADQFSRMVAHAIWELDDADRCHLLTYRDGFIHPKLYLRDGEDPALVMGSANITWDGLGKNLELAWYYRPETRTDPIFQTHMGWMTRFVDECEAITPADLAPLARLRRTADTWLSKGRINLPSMVRGAIPFLGRGSTTISPTFFESDGRDR